MANWVKTAAICKCHSCETSSIVAPFRKVPVQNDFKSQSRILSECKSSFRSCKVANSRVFDHSSTRSGQNRGYSQLHRTACWRNGSSRRILERPELFLNWAQKSFHKHRTSSDTSIATANRSTSSQARAPSSRAGPRLRKLWHFHAGAGFLPTPNALTGPRPI